MACSGGLWPRQSLLSRSRAVNRPPLQYGYDQVPALVHPAGTLLAGRLIRTNFVSACVVGPDPVPIVGCRRQWSTRSRLGARHITGELAAQSPCPA